MDKELLDWGKRNLRGKIKKAAEDITESFKKLNIDSDVIFRIIEMRFLKDPPLIAKEISQVVNLGRRTVEKIIRTFEYEVLDRGTVAGNTLIIYKSYGILYQMRQAIQTQQQRRRRRQQSQKTDPL